MTARYEQPGDSIEITAPVGGTTRGTPVVVNSRILGMPALTKLVTEKVNVKVSGIFEVTKVSAQAWVGGQPIYWDSANTQFTSVPGGLYAGVATRIAANPSTTGYILLSHSGQEAGFHIGTSAVPLVDDTVNVNFMSGYFDSGAVSSDSKGLAIVLNATGVLQLFSTAIYGSCQASVQVRNPVGVQGELVFGAGGWIQGLGYALGGYLSLPDATVAATGNVGCIVAEVAAPASLDISPATRSAVHQLRLAGAGQANYETNSTFFSFVGFTATAGVTKMLSSTKLAELPTGTIGIRVGVGAAGGGDTMYYIPLVLASEWD